MNRTLKLSMLMALALGTSQALALDLGQIRVKSMLGQPLLAEIPLHPANPAELQHLTVKLASAEDFARAGIVGGRTHVPLQFDVAGVGSDHPVIRITSNVAVDNPYLDLLLELDGSAGKSVREYAILLDPPSTAGAPAAQASGSSHATGSPVAAKSSRTASAAARPAVAARPRSPATHHAHTANGQYGPVEHGQTLSGIARSTAPDGTDINQMLVAIKQANPDAFYRDNINALKSGVVLRIPTDAESQAMTAAAAAAEVRRENSDWRAGATHAPTATVADAATRKTASSAPGNRSNELMDRLALVPAKDGAKGAGGQGSSAKGGTSASLQQELLRTRETLASVQQQGSELKSRLQDLSDINDKNKRLLALKDNEIAELQSKLAAARKAAGLPPVAAAGPAAGSSAAATAALAAGTGSQPAATGSSAVAQASTAQAPQAVQAPAKAASAPLAHPSPASQPAAKPVAKSRSAAHPPVTAEPWYMQTWAWAAGAGAVVILLLLALLGRRRKPSSTSAAGPKKGGPSLADRFGETAVPPVNDADDADQNELLDQLDEHPDDIGLHLELVSLYYGRRDVERFEAAAEAMHAHITDPQQPEWQDVVRMGKDLVPEHPLFDDHLELPADDEAEARRAFDIDDYAAEPPTSPLPEESSSPREVGGYNYNFTLSPVAGDDPDQTDEVAGEPEMPEIPDSLHESPEPAEPLATPSADEPATRWQFDEPQDDGDFNTGHELGEPSDDPVDTKLDLARAYIDMGDADGARAMLGEVIEEGSQMQKDVASRLLENLH